VASFFYHFFLPSGVEVELSRENDNDGVLSTIRYGNRLSNGQNTPPSSGVFGLLV
jgi:hypothetical protein